MLLMAPALGHAQSPQVIIAMENAWNRAELEKDAHAVGSLTADDFVMTVAEGTLMNKAQFVASISDPSYTPQILESDHMAVHFFNTTAIVTGAYHEKGLYNGKRWERRGRFTDVWIFLSGKWQCVSSHFSVQGG
jgi:ketosteroid isomerase-like protein